MEKARKKKLKVFVPWINPDYQMLTKQGREEEEGERENRMLQIQSKSLHFLWQVLFLHTQVPES